MRHGRIHKRDITDTECCCALPDWIGVFVRFHAGALCDRP